MIEGLLYYLSKMMDYFLILFLYHHIEYRTLEQYAEFWLREVAVHRSFFKLTFSESEKLFFFEENGLKESESRNNIDDDELVP